MRRIAFNLATIALVGLAVPARAADTASGGTDPLILIGGAVIILLLAVNLYVIWRRDLPILNPPTENQRPKPTGGGATPPPSYSEPGLKGYILHGFDHNNQTKRLEFTLEELQGDGCIIGRGNDAQKRLSDSRISRVHARLKLEGDQLQIENLKSDNKTFVNGFEIAWKRPQTIKVGDRIRFGPEVELKVGKLTA